MITSTSNQKIKYIRRLISDRRFRHREGFYVVEGSRWVEELVQHKISPNLVLVSQSFRDKELYRYRLQESLEVSLIEVSDQVMAYTSDTVTPSGILAVVPMQNRPLPSRLSFLLILDNISNPGNLGSILRTAAGANVDAVLLAPGCVDMYNPKVLRGGMGAHLKLPIREYDWDEIAALTSNLSIWIASAGVGVDYIDVDWQKNVAIIIGGEARGAGHQSRSLTTGLVSIPLSRNTESLNAAVATGVLLFEVVRKRRIRNGS